MTINSVLVDDILGQAPDPNSSYGSATFQAVHGRDEIRFVFVTPFDHFLGRYDLQAAVEAFDRLAEAPDIFLVDLNYEEEGPGELHLGLRIVEWLSRSKRFSRIPRTLFTTTAQDQPASGFEGQTVGEVLSRYQTPYINKDIALAGILIDVILPMVER